MRSGKFTNKVFRSEDFFCLPPVRTALPKLACNILIFFPFLLKKNRAPQETIHLSIRCFNLWLLTSRLPPSSSLGLFLSAYHQYLNNNTYCRRNLAVIKCNALGGGGRQMAQRWEERCIAIIG